MSITLPRITLAGLASLAALASVAVGLPAVPASAAAPTVTVTPTTFARGADSDVAYVRDGDVVVQGTRIPVPGSRPEAVGTYQDGAIVATTVAGKRRLVLVAPDAEPVNLASLRGGVAIARPTRGREVVSVDHHDYSRGRTTIVVVDVATGEKVGSRTFAGFARVLDATSQRAVVTTNRQHRTISWNLASDAARVISGRQASAADIAADRLALPSTTDGASTCGEVVKLSAPSRRIWRSCSADVRGFGPSGRFVTTTVVGSGPADATLRTPAGRPVATYENPKGAILLADWNDDDSVDLVVGAGSRAAVVTVAGRSGYRSSAYFTPTFD